MGGDQEAYLAYPDRPSSFTIPAGQSSVEIEVRTSQQMDGDYYEMTLAIDASNDYLIGNPNMVLVYVSQFAESGPPTGQLRISGVAEIGRDLMVDMSGVTDPDGIDSSSLTYSWQRANNASGSGKANIAGGNSATYSVDSADDGKVLR